MENKVEGQRRKRGGQLKEPQERKRNNLTFRARDRLKADLEAAAVKSGRSVSEEIEFRLTRDISWEATREDIQRLLVEAKAIRQAARIQAIRDAGLRVIREHGIDGVNVVVQISAEMLLAEADGILRSGFVAAEDVHKTSLEILVKRAVTEALETAGLAKGGKE